MGYKAIISQNWCHNWDKKPKIGQLWHKKWKLYDKIIIMISKVKLKWLKKNIRLTLKSIKWVDVTEYECAFVFHPKYEILQTDFAW